MHSLNEFLHKAHSKNLVKCLIAMFSITILIAGCGGGGGGGGSSDSIQNPVRIPDISVSNSQLEFNGVVVNEFMDQSITVTNAGGGKLVIGQIAQANPLSAPFSITADNCSGKTLEANWTCNIEIQFAPTSIGASQDSFDIPSNDSDENPVTVNLTGDGNGLNVSINQVFTNSCPDINLLVSVTEVNGNAVNNLTDNNFSVFENDIAVNSFSVSNAALPASVTLIFDYSESFSAALQSALDGGKIFIGNLNLTRRRRIVMKVRS